MSVDPETVSSEEKEQYIPLSEIAKHTTAESPWLAINGKVYDVSSFIDQHPGGEEVILESAGTDATGPFEDVGHSDHAIELLEGLYIGEGNPEELKIIKRKDNSVSLEEGGSNNTLVMIVCVLVAAAAYYYFKALKD